MEITVPTAARADWLSILRERARLEFQDAIRRTIVSREDDSALPRLFQGALRVSLNGIPLIYTLQMFSAKELLLADVGYSGWANERLLDACSDITSAHLEHDLGVSHAHILATLRHICDGEKVWLDCLSGTPDGGSWRLPQGLSPEVSLAELKQCWPELWAGYRAWLKNTSDNGLENGITVHLPDGISPSIARWKILRHVLDHSTFHRGQVIGMLRALGQTPPAINRMDYVLSGG
jgi:uncharacterized damage-inducible protein DinB